MTKFDDTLELLNKLIHSTVHDMLKISKASLFDINTCLQNAQEKVEFLQLESQLQQVELQKWSHHFELVCVHKIERDSHKQQVSNVAVDSHSVPS